MKPENQRITLEVPTDLGDGPLVIVLVNKDGRFSKPLGDISMTKATEELGEQVADLRRDLDALQAKVELMPGYEKSEGWQSWSAIKERDVEVARNQKVVDNRNRR